MSPKGNPGYAANRRPIACYDLHSGGVWIDEFGLREVLEIR